jgi:NDP-sugar pyrophosphorylase family protein
MMPVAGKPMIARVLDRLAAGGATHFILVVHPRMTDLLKYASDSAWADEIQLVYQQQRLGMVHALECAAPDIRETGAADFLLTACDSLYPKDHLVHLVARHRRDSLNATLTLMWVAPEKATSSAVVVVEDRRIANIIEKPRLEEMPSYGNCQKALSAPSLYALSPRVLEYLSAVTPSSRGERDFPDALRLLIEAGGRVGGQLVEDRMTLTYPDDLLVINRYVLHSDPTCATIETTMPDNVIITPPVRIEAGTTVGSRCRIGPEVYLETGCSLGPSAVVRRAVVLRSGVVEAGQMVSETVIA